MTLRRSFIPILTLAVIAISISLAFALFSNSAHAQSDEDLPSVEGFNHLFGDSEPGLETKQVAPNAQGLQYVQPIPIDLTISASQGCGSFYYRGAYISFTIRPPEQGTLTLYSSVNGTWWRRFAGPHWVTPGYPYRFDGIIAPPMGNELVYAILRAPDGRVLKGLCYFTSGDYPQPAPTPTPIPLPPTPTPVPPIGGTGPQCFVQMPQTVSPGENFSIRVGVMNTGYQPLYSTSMASYVSPSGYFTIQSCTPYCQFLQPGVYSWLGALSPGETDYVNLWVQAPYVTGSYTLDFYVDSQYATSSLCERVYLTVGEAYYSIGPDEPSTMMIEPQGGMMEEAP